MSILLRFREDILVVVQLSIALDVSLQEYTSRLWTRHLAMDIYCVDQGGLREEDLLGALDIVINTAYVCA